MNESEIVSTFLKPENRERIKSLLEGKKSRKIFLSTLSHNFIEKVDPKYVRRVGGNKQEIIKKVLRYFQKKEFKIISEYSEFDKSETELNEALEKIIGFGMGTIIYSIDGNLMYYEGEDIKESYLLIKNAL